MRLLASVNKLGFSIYFCLILCSKIKTLKKLQLLFLLTSVLTVSCEKGTEWDTPLNGKWVEVSNNNTRALPSNCDIEFADGVMILCNESIGKDLNHESKIHAQNGQIWISYRLSFRKHEEYRYDYELNGDSLWIIENTSPDFTPLLNNPKAKKYLKR